MAVKDHKDSSNGQIYRAPALEKGLDIMELLAAESEPLTLSTIVERLGRSTGELFRMIQVLEYRGFVSQDHQGYALTSRLFEISLGRPPLRDMIEIALPLMRSLSIDTAQSCHLAVRSGSNIVVVARMESREQLGFSVRVGYNQPLHLTNSGRILYAFQRDDVRAEWEASFDPRPSKAALIAFRRSCNELRQERFSQRQSEFVEGITDLSAPVLRGNYADAALSVPFFHYKAPKLGIDDVGKMLRDTAAALSTELMLSDSRV